MTLVSVAIVVSFFLLFSIGFFLGAKCSLINNRVETDEKQFTLNRQTRNKARVKNAIDIDDKKIVLKINTENIEKKFNKIAESKETQNDIVDSVNKLKKMRSQNE